MADKRYKYQKVESLHDIDELHDKTLTIIGLGGIGTRVAEAVVREGLNVRLIDRGRVKKEHIPRNTYYTEKEDTKFKVKQSKKFLKKLNSKVIIKAFHEELGENNRYLMNGDLVVDTTNDPDLQSIIQEYCEEQDLQYIHAYDGGIKAAVYTNKSGKPDFESWKRTGSSTATLNLTAGTVLREVFKALKTPGHENEAHINIEDLSLTTE